MTTQESIDRLCNLVEQDILSKPHVSTEPKMNPILVWIAGIGASAGAALLVAVIIGATTMMSRHDTANELASQKFEFVSEQLIDLKGQISDLEVKVESGTADRWTKTQQRDFADDVEDKFDELDAMNRRQWDAINSMTGSMNTGERKTN